MGGNTMKKIFACILISMVVILGSMSALADPWPNPVTESVENPIVTTISE